MTYLSHIIQEKYGGSHDMQDSRPDIEEDLKSKVDSKQENYVPIKKDQFLGDMKKFIYNYCCTGQLYPNYQ